jgi:hypothetical protein
MHGHSFVVARDFGVTIHEMKLPGVLSIVLMVFGGWQTPGGSVSGTLKNDAGAPAAGVRVAAMAVQEIGAGAEGPSVLVSLAQTDGLGRYRLDNIPPGLYYIAAGLVSAPTYYPGSINPTPSSVVRITSGVALSGYDFSTVAPLVATDRFGSSPSRLPTVPVRVVTEDGKPVPPTAVPWLVFAHGPSLRRSYEGGWALAFELPEDDYRISVEGLPLGYRLKSITYRNVDAGFRPFRINGSVPGEIVLTLAVTPLSSIPGVNVRGKVLNMAREWPAGGRTVRLYSLNTGTSIETPLNADGTFEFPKAPADAYFAGLAGFTRGSSVFPVVTVGGVDIQDVAIDLKNNPFPEYPGGSYIPILGQNPLTVRGVLTEAPTAIGPTVRYLRMEVKDENTGMVTPWAALLMTRISPARLVELLHLEVGAPVTVVGVGANDGSKRMFIDTRVKRGDAPHSINGVAVPATDEAARD